MTPEEYYVYVYDNCRCCLCPVCEVRMAEQARAQGTHPWNPSSFVKPWPNSAPADLAEAEANLDLNDPRY
jgi:hypothetical protein